MNDDYLLPRNDGVFAKLSAKVGRLQSRARDLAMLSLQSERYAQDADFREAVDDVLALTR